MKGNPENKANAQNTRVFRGETATDKDAEGRETRTTRGPLKEQAPDKDAVPPTETK